MDGSITFVVDLFFWSMFHSFDKVKMTLMLHQQLVGFEEDEFIKSRKFKTICIKRNSFHSVRLILNGILVVTDFMITADSSILFN